MADSTQRWWLDDAEARNREHPDSFFIPPRERRERLVPGDSVKLVFRFEPGPGPSAERMWVDVVSASAGSYVGKLVNEPEHIRELKPGAVVEFEPHHVAAVAVSEEEVGYNVDAFAVVSRRIRDEGAWPHFVYRMEPSLREDEDDSGWQLWAREDDDEYANDGDNLLLWELGWIKDKFPAVEPLLASGEEEGQWWWDERSASYRRRA
jgi:hypothetical protein